MPPAGSPDWLLRTTGLVAMAGSLQALAVASLVIVSVLGRWLADRPIEGDFELVKLGTAIAVFTFLPYTQARHGHVLVDTFTGRFQPTTCDRIDGCWDLVLSALMAVFATGLAIGTLEALASGESTMQLQLLVWPVIGICALLGALLVVTAAVTGIGRLRQRP